MNALVCGLNSYLGRASLLYLQDELFQVHGIVRDSTLIHSKIQGPIRATLYDVDIIRYNPENINVYIPDCQLAFYFTQTPELIDDISSHYEILSLRNYILFSQKNNCNRIIYIGTIYNRKHLTAIEKLFNELQVQYTIVIKDVAIGNHTSFEDFMQKMLKNKLIYLYKPAKNILLRPTTLKDLMEWLRTTDWKTNYIDSYVEFGGQKAIELEQIMKYYEEKLSPHTKHFTLPINNKKLSISLNKYISNVPYAQYAEFIAELSSRKEIDSLIDYKVSYPPIEKLIES